MVKRLHIGCGTVYLDPKAGWVNCDVQDRGVYLAKDRPDLVEKYITDDAHYYGRHQDKNIETLRGGPVTREFVCDAYASFEHLPAGAREVDEVLVRHAFEHLSFAEARRALDEMDRVLAPGGVVRIDVPDHEKTIQLYFQTGDPFYKRHLFGPRRNEFGYHMMSYTRERLIGLVQEFGFRFETEEDNPHFYPAFTLCFRKPPMQQARDYALRGIAISKAWLTCEVGPGPYPWESADIYIDHDPAVLDRIDVTKPPYLGKRKVVADIQQRTEFPDKYFDYAFISHVLEHLQDPMAAAREISRISKRGCVSVPHALCEFMFNFEAQDHLWWCFPPRRPGGPLGMMKADEALKGRIVDQEFQHCLCRLFRTGPNTMEHDQRYLRNWYADHETDMDVIVHWDGEFSAEILTW